MAELAEDEVAVVAGLQESQLDSLAGGLQQLPGQLRQVLHLV